MSAFALAVLTLALWTGWALLGKVALDTAAPAQATLLYGLAAVLAGALSLGLVLQPLSWSAGALGLAAVSAALGGAGLVSFYLALERGAASLVVPVAGAYPAVVALLSVAFLSERMTGTQVAGVGLAVTGVLLIGAGG